MCGIEVSYRRWVPRVPSTAELAMHAGTYQGTCASRGCGVCSLGHDQEGTVGTTWGNPGDR